MDLSKCDYSVFIDDYGLTVAQEGYDRTGRAAYRIKLYVAGELVHSDVMSSYYQNRQHVVGSAIAFMTDYNICEEAGILEIWYNDRRCEQLSCIGHDIDEEPDVYEDGQLVEVPHVKY